MNDLTKFTNQLAKPETFDEIQIGINVATYRFLSFDDRTRPEDADS